MSRFQLNDMIEKKICVAARFAAAALLLVSAGCGGSETTGPTRYKLSGTVTYKGEPIPRGTLTLAPDSSQQNQGPGSFCTIKNGKFQTAPGKGVVGGHYIVTVNGYQESKADDEVELFPGYDINADFPMKDSIFDIKVAE